MAGISKRFAENVGKYFRKLGELEWFAAEVGKQAASTFLWNTDGGRKVKAWIRAHVYYHEKDQDGRIIKKHHYADSYECEDGYEYLRIQGVTYRHNLQTGGFDKI